MDAEKDNRLNYMEHMLYEINELLQHVKYLKEERRLMMEDLATIKSKKNTKLNIDYTTMYNRKVPKL